MFVKVSSMSDYRSTKVKKYKKDDLVGPNIKVGPDE